MASSILAFLVATIAIVVFRLRKVGQRPTGCPPGPPTLPIIGNLHQIPKTNAHVQFKKWADEYGPIYSLIVGTTVTIVLSSDTVIKDLLDKRSGIYSSRPDMYISSLASGGLRMVIMKYGDTWRHMRKLFHALLHLKAAKSYVPYQDLESTSMMIALLDKPNLVFDHIRRFTNSLATQIVYGFRTPSVDDPKLLRCYESVEKWSAVTGAGAAALLDVFPILQSLPALIRPLYYYALSLRDSTLDFSVGLWKDAKRQLMEGTAKPSFCVGLAKAQAQEGFSDEILAMVAGSALEASSDTTASTVAGFCQAMVLYPDAQRKAQAAIDLVCGDRYPDIDDMNKPEAQYIRSCVKESLRWMPTAVLGIPHAVIRDDEYMGYKIPKGASVVYNVWAVHMDPRRHLDPRTFDPSRYEHDSTTSSESTQSPDVSKRDHFGFGAGRRVCEGMHFVDRSMFLVIARLMWAFDMSKAVDADGNEITPDQDDLVGGILMQPRPFPMKITPRSESRAAKVREAWAECQALLDKEQQWRQTPKGMPFTDYEAAV
ncbi:O-methylsterigmatocystin oxidoreductase [Chaetomidium leptoderma]|uniref:O-methylsterigmatocystin oxidoreductase n=1 Tax=Chaetomidium leptoderma TaxID=669021 RepID=A0AAN6VFZ3_9PEZI|nr:O-methylsterigmatocystin oxidoreductase [Chaetomidium leptoderma]